MAIDKELLDILACPKCKGPIALNRAGDGLACTACELLYEIEDDIPIMLIDEARPFGEVAAERLAGVGAVKPEPAKKGKKAASKRPAKKKPAKKSAKKKSGKKASGNQGGDGAGS